MGEGGLGVSIGGNLERRRATMGASMGILGGMVLGNILPDPIGDALHFLWAQPLLARNCVSAQVWPGWQCASLQVIDWYILAGLGWIALLLIFLPLSMSRRQEHLGRVVLAAVGVFVAAGILLNLYWGAPLLGFGPRGLTG